MTGSLDDPVRNYGRAGPFERRSSVITGYVPFIADYVLITCQLQFLITSFFDYNLLILLIFY